MLSKVSRASRFVSILSKGAARALPMASFASLSASAPMKAAVRPVTMPTLESLVFKAPLRAFSVDPASDAAFQPQKKAAAAPASAEEEEMSEMLRQIGEVVANNKVVLFMKGVPEQPQCGFSSRVVQILSHLNVQYEACNVLDSPVLREGIKKFSDWPTIPQLYVNGEFVGGCDIVTSMFTSGELHQLFGLEKPKAE